MNFNKFKSILLDLIKLSMPILGGNLAQILIGFSDTIIAGRYSTETLGAISVASAIVMTITIGAIGLVLSISPVISNLRGLKHPSKKYFNLTLIFSILVSIPFFLILRLFLLKIDLIGLSPDMIDDISRNDFQYPVIECIEAKLSISLLITYLLFGITFGGIGSWMFFSMIGGLKGAGFFTGGWLGALFCLPFIAVGVFMSGKVIASIVRIVRVKLSGEQLIATVYDYFDDSSLRINGRPAQTVKLVADLPQGTRFLMYQLGSVSQPYPIGSQVELLYKDKLYYLKGEYFG